MDDRESKKDESSRNQLNLETEKETRQRWISIYVIYFTVFLMSLGFSIVLTGVWPYLNKLDHTLDKEFMGWVVAANPLAQMIFSPVAGWWANKLGSIRLPLISSLVLFTLASIQYSVLHVFPTFRGYWMIVSRFLVGASSANMAVCRSYMSAATKLEERTYAVSMISLAQVLGFIVGPAVQAGVTVLGNEGTMLWENGLCLDMYTASGWVSVLLGVINLILLCPFCFQERTIAAREAMLLTGAPTEKAAWKGARLDYLSAWTLIWAFFIFSFNFVLLETLSTSLTMDQFAWSTEESLYYLGFLMSAGGVIACATFAVLGSLCKRFGEISVLMWGGFLLMVVGGVAFIPWGTPPPLIFYPDDINSTGLGCPATQEWCFYTPALTVQQFFVGFAFIAFGYPIGITLLQTIFSKILGPRPQGVWMGLMTGAGCLSRVMGPVFVSIIYARFGTIWTFGLTAGMMVGAMLWIQIVLKRLKAAFNKAVNLQPASDPSLKQTDTELEEMTSSLS